MSDLHNWRGILYPTRLPTFHREPAPSSVSAHIRWFWVPRWHLAPGRTSRQTVLPFPACNLVVTADGVELVGPSLGISYRDLVGTGWAVGALLRPAAAATLASDLTGLRGRSVPVECPALFEQVCAVMHSNEADQARRDAVDAFVAWAAQQLPEPNEQALLANQMEDIIADTPALVRVEQLARALGLSVRAVQRLARKYVGVSPMAMIRRYRLQEAAQQLRSNPTASIADIAHELGYADHAHLTADFRRTLGFTPKTYRSE